MTGCADGFWVAGRAVTQSDCSPSHFRAYTTQPTPHPTLQVMEFPSEGLPPNCARHLVFLWFAQWAFLFPIPPSPDGRQVAFPLVGRMPGINASFEWQHFKTEVEGKVPAAPARIPVAFERIEVSVRKRGSGGDD